MLADAHFHPYDLVRVFPQAEQEFNSRETLAASSACTFEEFLFSEELARNVPARVFPCFGIHPQYIKVRNESKEDIKDLIEKIDLLALEKRIFAVGECGFDLYNAAFRETEAQQEKVFAEHLEIAIRHDLPVVIHARRAMQKIFALTKILSKCKAVVFHSWPGTLDEAQALLRRGVNAYFSFGNAIMLNHKQAIKSCSLLPAERLLTETDAPYQPRRTESYSCRADLPLILNTVAAARTEAGNKISAEELELQIERNFLKIFN